LSLWLGGAALRALVTGGAGLVGSEIADLLLSNGHQVVSVDNYVAGKRVNNEAASSNPNFESMEGDITDEKFIDEVLGSGIDWIFHEAVSKNTVCLIDPNKDLEVNAGGTLKLLMAARKHNVSRFIHASTGSVYGPAKNFPTNEQHRKDPASFYGISKLAAESYVQLFHDFYGLQTTVLRYFHVFGARQDSSDVGGVVSIFLRRAMEGQELQVTGDGSQLRAFTHVSDVARINLLAAESPSAIGQIYNCASDSRITIRELAEAVIKRVENSSSLIRFTEPRIGDIHKFDIDNQKLKNELGFNFSTSFESGLEITYQEMRNNFLNPN
jgi:nucleoside-diphosphate-sugar epimerase